MGHPEFTDEMHEGHFRSGLDRFIWIFGMAFSLHFDNFDSFLAWLGTGSKSWIKYVGMGVVVLLLTSIWVFNVFFQGKLEYNRLHPFTSALPIVMYLLLRNACPWLRQRYLYLFAYLGRITLETYILQFHIWMKTTGVNGSPKKLLVVIPGHFWANFIVVSLAYLFMSVRL